jgi:hypothetical protein
MAAPILDVPSSPPRASYAPRVRQGRAGRSREECDAAPLHGVLGGLGGEAGALQVIDIAW